MRYLSCLATCLLVQQGRATLHRKPRPLIRTVAPPPHRPADVGRAQRWHMLVLGGWSPPLRLRHLHPFNPLHVRAEADRFYLTSRPARYTLTCTGAVDQHLGANMSDFCHFFVTISIPFSFLPTDTLWRSRTGGGSSRRQL